MLRTITRGASSASCYPMHRAPRHCCSPGAGMAWTLRDAGSRIVLTVPVRAGTEGQVGAQHHGRDQVLKGWDLNQRQPGEGDSKGTLGRKEGTGLLPKPWLPEERGMGREGDENPKVAGGHPISQMCPSTSQAAAHGMRAEVRGFAKAHTQPLHGAWAARAQGSLEELCMVLEQGSEEPEGKHKQFC